MRRGEDICSDAQFGRLATVARRASACCGHSFGPQLRMAWRSKAVLTGTAMSMKRSPKPRMLPIAPPNGGD